MNPTGMNPTGLNGKVAYCAALPEGIFGVSESHQSHLSSQGVVQFRLGLKLAGSPHKFLPGAHVPCRARSHSSGGYSGAGFLSREAYLMRDRKTCGPWPGCRLHRSLCLPLGCRMLWCTDMLHHLHALTRCLMLLRLGLLIKRLDRGLILGDFNLTPEAVVQAREWESQGFVEVQTLAAQRWGLAPQAICKNCIRKDRICISRELQALLTQVEVQKCWFPDHDLLLASFPGWCGVCPSRCLALNHWSL